MNARDALDWSLPIADGSPDPWPAAEAVIDAMHRDGLSTREMVAWIEARLAVLELPKMLVGRMN